MKFKVNQPVKHETYGVGVVIDSWLSKRGSENYAVKFDNGGPQGWAENATHDISELTAVK